VPHHFVIVDVDSFTSGVMNAFSVLRPSSTAPPEVHWERLKPWLTGDARAQAVLIACFPGAAALLRTARTTGWQKQFLSKYCSPSEAMAALLRQWRCMFAVGEKGTRISLVSDSPAWAYHANRLAAKLSADSVHVWSWKPPLSKPKPRFTSRLFALSEDCRSLCESGTRSAAVNVLEFRLLSMRFESLKQRKAPTEHIQRFRVRARADSRDGAAAGLLWHELQDALWRDPTGPALRACAGERDQFGRFHEFALSTTSALPHFEYACTAALSPLSRH
jgi:hypothetical protein